MEIYCPQCEADCQIDNLQRGEGVCEECHKENTSRLIEHYARFDWWNRLTEKERDQHIKRAMFLA